MLAEIRLPMPIIGLNGGRGEASSATNDWGKSFNLLGNNMLNTTISKPGMALRTGATLLSGSVVADTMGGITLFDYLLSASAGEFYVLGDSLSSFLATSAVITTAITSAVTGIGFEVGVGIGSIPSALEGSLVRPPPMCKKP